MITPSDLRAFRTYEMQFTVSPCAVTPNGTLRPSEFLRRMQEIADKDSARCGISTEELRREDLFVALSRCSVSVYQYPTTGDAVRLITLHRTVKGARMYRDFLFFSDEHLMAEATTEYCVVHRGTRRAVPPEIYLRNPNFAPQSYKPGNPQPKRISPPEKRFSMGSRKVYYSHLDENGHMNNANYCDFATDALPSALRSTPPDFFELNYQREAPYQSGIQLEYGYDGTDMFIVGERDDRPCFCARFHYQNPPHYSYEEHLFTRKTENEKGTES